MTDWQPIETAPKDGTEILGWCPYHGSAGRGSTWVIRWNEEKHTKKPRPYFDASGWVWGVTDLRKHQPTHWMPLPAPPLKEPKA